MAQVFDTDAAGGVQGAIRSATAGKIRSAGGTVNHAPEASYPGEPINEQQVDVTEGPGATVFGDLFPNPVPKQDRVAGKPRVGN